VALPRAPPFLTGGVRQIVSAPMRYDAAQINRFDLTRYPDYRGDFPPDACSWGRAATLRKYLRDHVFFVREGEDKGRREAKGYIRERLVFLKPD
jgi:hypothetical protein